MLKQSLNQKMLQKLSPQQIQLMKLLQVPTANLEQRVKEELEANPALEEGSPEEDLAGEEGFDREEDRQQDDTYELDDYIKEYIEEDPASYKLRTSHATPDAEDKQVPIAVESTFHDYLEQQLGMMELENKREEAIAHQIIGSIDSDGYLRRDPVAIIDDLMFAQNIFVSEEEVEKTLKKIQQFDPPGVAARDLQECLLLQLENKVEQAEGMSSEERRPLLLALEIIRDHFDEFSKKHFNKLLKQLDIGEEELKEAMDVILKLNPKPASGHATESRRSPHYIVPDFIISNRDGELELSLNTRNAPDLHISNQYRDMLKAYRKRKKDKSKENTQRDKEAFVFVKQKIDSAKWFIDAIRQRQETMYKTMYAIMQYQYDFFLTGDQRKLRPMILKDIADITGLDISTISRVVNSKYVQTEFGTKRLKDFFSESLQTSEGEEVSTLEVKKILADIVENEDKRKPLSDEKIKNLLRKKGYHIARRTVAKYREQLNIPVARLRKEL
jgi:RNA polymerase sigma-54 factor